ncbi:MAG: O-antigen ligase family protein [Patescibacteria group bacterium]|nr:O-antigen ligase family protein [Patescibacteria group bacterium]
MAMNLQDNILIHIWRKLWINAEKIATVVTIAAAFFNIGFWLENSNSFRSGLFDPFVTPKVQLFDVCFLITVVIYLFKYFTCKPKEDIKTPIFSSHRKKILTVISVAIALVLASSILGLNPSNSVFFILRLAECIGIYIILKSGIFQSDKLVSLLSNLGIFQSVLAIWQVIIGRSIGLNILGESPISTNISGVAKFTLFGNEILRGYGTFPHANILGGVLAGIFTLVLVSENKSKYYYVKLAILALGILSTGSRAAILGVILTVIFTLFISKNSLNRLIKTILITGISLALAIIAIRFATQNNIFKERLSGYFISQEIIFENPIFGVGPGNYTLALDSKAGLSAWEIQPVHSIPILIMAEIGLPSGLIIIAMLVLFFWRRILWAKNKTIAIILTLSPLLLFDHCFWDIPQALIIFTIFLFLISKFDRERLKMNTEDTVLGKYKQRLGRSPRFRHNTHVSNI